MTFEKIGTISWVFLMILTARLEIRVGGGAVLGMHS